MSNNHKLASWKEIFGWCMFDFANSSYTTVIISVVFCDVFAEIIVAPVGDDPETKFQHGNFLWGIFLAISYLITVFLGPVFGSISDFTPRKKLFLFVSYLGCVISTAALYFVRPDYVILGGVLIVISNLFFSLGENFASAFLPFLGPKEMLGKISGFAWGIGYFGGIGSVILVSLLGDVTLENFDKLVYIGPITAAFFLVAAIPTFVFLKEPHVHHEQKRKRDIIKESYHRIYETFTHIKQFKDVLIFLISLFFTMAAMGIVVSFSFIYGSEEIHIQSQHRTAMFLLIQLTAALGAVLFGVVQDKIGSMKTLNITLMNWILLVLGVYFIREITQYLNQSFQLDWTVQWVFVGLTALAGLGLGSTQSASRTIVGLFSPEAKTGEFYGLWGFSGKIASAFGLIAISFLQLIFSLHNAFLAVGAFFLVSLVVNFFVNEERGLKTAEDYREE
jgi:UMF1 family MFS transporter